MRKLMLLPPDAERVIQFGEAGRQSIGVIVPGGEREITLKFAPQLTNPDRVVKHQAHKQLWVWDAGAIYVLHAPPAPPVPYRLGNVAEDGSVCWGSYAAAPYHLREAVSRFWESKFNLDLTPVWRTHSMPGGCPERQHSCQGIREGRNCRRNHACGTNAATGLWECRQESHVDYHECGNMRHGKKCPVLHERHTVGKRGCPCCRRRPTCGCMPLCSCCRKTCRCCPCRGGNCNCPRMTCTCCNGLCRCMQAPCSHKLDEELIRIHQDYLPDYLARGAPSAVHNPQTELPVVPALMWVTTPQPVAPYETYEFLPLQRNPAGGWLDARTMQPVEGPTR